MKKHRIIIYANVCFYFFYDMVGFVRSLADNMKGSKEFGLH